MKNYVSFNYFDFFLAVEGCFNKRDWIFDEISKILLQASLK